MGLVLLHTFRSKGRGRGLAVGWRQLANGLVVLRERARGRRHVMEERYKCERERRPARQHALVPRSSGSTAGAGAARTAAPRTGATEPGGGPKRSGCGPGWWGRSEEGPPDETARSGAHQRTLHGGIHQTPRSEAPKSQRRI